jgi:ABC-2 type transport system permease protein
MNRFLLHLRLWRRFLLLAVARETEYRGNLLATTLEGAAQVALAIVTFLVVYRFTASIAGWTRDQALVLAGIYRVADGLISLQIAPNMISISGAIRRGELDYVLLRPVSSQFLISTRTLNLAEGVNVFIGLGIVAYAGSRAGIAWTPIHLAEAASLLFWGLLLLYTVWFAIMTCSFWLVQIDNLDNLFLGAIEGAKYPLSYFKGVVRAFLTFVIPVAFATTFPTEALLGRVDVRLLLAGPALALTALLATHLYWNLAVRNYSSASS